MLILHCFDIPFIKSKYVPDSIVMAAILSGISYSVRKDKEVAPATPKVEINMNPIYSQLVHIPTLIPITEPTIPVPVFLAFDFITRI